MNKTTTKKLAGGLLVSLLLGAIGAVLVSAETSLSEEETIEEQPQFCGPMFQRSPWFPELTEEQQEELDQLRDDLQTEGATSEEIRDAIGDKLDEYGVLDEQLDDAILRAEQQLQLLNRKKELRDQGYSWEEIQDIISEEFDLEFPQGEDQGMMFGHGHHCGPRDFMSGE